MTSPTISAHPAARMEPLGLPAAPPPGTAKGSEQPPAAAIAFRLATLLKGRKGQWLYLASSERRAEETARALHGFAPDAEVLYLPTWDCLPYDRAAPSAEIMGKRLAVLRRCLVPAEGHRVVVVSPEGAVQKLPPAAAVAGAGFTVKLGEALDRDVFAQWALCTGYLIDERVDEPGEIALRGNVVEVFPAGAEEPVRITDAEGVVATMTRFDPRTQRSIDELAVLELGPASEVIADDPDHARGGEHRLAAHYGTLATIFDYLPKARLVAAGPSPARLERVQAQLIEAHDTAADLGEERPAPVTDLYLDAESWAAAQAGTKSVALELEGLEPVSAFAAERQPGRALVEFVRAAKGAVVVCGIQGERQRLQSLFKRNKVKVTDLDGSVLELGGKAGVWLADADLDAGFIDAPAGLSVVAAADVLGSRLHEEQTDLAVFAAPAQLRVGDVVVHEDHGVGVLRDLTRVATDGVEQDTIRLEYHGDTTVMVPVADFGKLWRYGADAEAVTLDRLNTEGWNKKRAAVSAEIDAAAAGLAELARQRLAAEAVVIEPPKAEYDRLAARFPYPETPDQNAAIRAVLADLASGHPMNRLVCGDVGFGKTEIALRAAAAAALSGRQVAVIAPTTVLARQHLQSFERRFAGTKITVGTLSRLNAPAEAAATKEGLRDGSLRIVVATQAIAGKDVDLPELGLVIIDEEQRFGAKLKRQVQELARNVHLLTMSATPIPRSLQAAMVGLQEVSILATPPARRRPIRTFLAPFDAATARTALVREQRRGGQSFVVVPRIEDIERVGAELQRIVPDLKVIAAHGDLAAKDIDGALLRFANGEGDVLLATSIIESGLDVPRANTMLVWRADRFGLAQLHQLRGRVGRGRTQGIAYLFTEPGQDVADGTKARLSTLQAFDRLGSGFDISARDLELRGAGDLLGEHQAGHVHLIGATLYQQLLERALGQIKGAGSGETRAAELHLGLAGSIPADYVPEAVVRIDLYARLQRLTRIEDLEEFAGEVEDRFGALPPEVETLLALSRLAIRAGMLGIERVDAGPLAIALTPARGVDAKAVMAKVKGKPKSAEKRLVYERQESADVIEDVAALLGDEVVNS